MENEKKEQCFVIMPISDQGDYPQGHFDKVYEQIFKPAIQAAGYEAHRVDEDHICDSIISKIFLALQEAPMALCDLSNRNPNVLYELGIRQAYDKPVVLVQDDKTDKIFDVSGINTVYYKSMRLYEDVLEARKKITDAIISTKEGKQNSIVKVVNVQKAIVSSAEMTREDRIEVLLSGLIKDVNDIKRENARIEYSKKNSNLRGIPFTDWNRTINSSENFSPTEFAQAIIELKRGVTEKQISRMVLDVSQQLNTRIMYKKDGEYLYLTIYENDDDVVKEVCAWFQGTIGKNKEVN